MRIELPYPTLQDCWNAYVMVEADPSRLYYNRDDIDTVEYGCIRRIKPYVDDVIDNEYILDIILGVGIFIIVIFLILMINKGISKAVKFSGLGKLDTVFGFFFGFLRGYVICVCIFATTNIFYNYNKWPLNTKSSWTFPYVQKGSNYLLKEFPNEKKYKKSKEKIKDI